MTGKTDREILDGLIALLGDEAGFILLVQDHPDAPSIRCVSTMSPPAVGQVLQKAADEIAQGNTIYQHTMKPRERQP